MQDRLRRIDPWPARLARLALALSSAWGLGCNLIAKTDDFRVGAAIESDACTVGSAGCPSGKCTFSFDNHRIPGLLADGSLPPLPEAGAAPAGDGGGDDGAADDGSGDESTGDDSEETRAGQMRRE